MIVVEKNAVSATLENARDAFMKKNDEPTGLNGNEGLHCSLNGQHDSGGKTKPLTGTSRNEIDDSIKKN